MTDKSTNEPQSETSRGTPNHPPVLRREAVYVVTDPRKFAGVAAVTALAGVAIGFALALLAQPPHQCTVADRVHVIEGSTVKTTPVPLQHSPEWRLTWLGVQVQSAGHGAAVVEVFDDTPAQKSGLRPGDVIQSLDDQDINTASDLVRAVRVREPHEQISLQVIRDGQERTVEAILTHISRDEIPRF